MLQVRPDASTPTDSPSNRSAQHVTGLTSEPRMYDEIATKCIASCMGLAGFVIAMVVGMFAHVPLETAILRGVLAMLVCWPVGYIVGHISSSVVNQALIKRAEAAKATTREAAKKAREEAERLRRESGDSEVLEL
ncbi:MAG: hypothetical protein MUE97_01320 [Phycisphaerales bacterium]|nr:hypothetical protein [Phycisphaerales bacterium]